MAPQSLEAAFQRYPKLMLTVPPLQNTLFELNGLASAVDDRDVGNLKRFKEVFANLHVKAAFGFGKAPRLLLCPHALRRQILLYALHDKAAHRAAVDSGEKQRPPLPFWVQTTCAGTNL